jgi:uncharacterized paraquat-inducible protein A
MALVKCHECGKEISAQAAVCPSCGAPAKKKTSPVTVVVAVLIAAVAVFAVLGGQPRGSSAAHQQQVEACVARGVQYFKDVGSFPTLTAAPNKGKDAAVEARERCNRTLTAF